MKIHDILETTISGLGFEFVDVEITPAKIIRVFADKEGGIGVDDCAIISNQLSKVFLVEEIDYNRLEISSPGLERPLKKIEDFVRFKDKLCKLKTFELIDNQKVFQGRILGVENNLVSLELTADKKIVSIDFADISRARLIYEPKSK